MIYFDNAATSRQKPEAVYDAFHYYMKEIGASPGRGSYTLAVQASRMLYQTRKTVSNFFGIADPSNVVFTKNSTEAINLFLNGFLKKGDHVLISPYEHNAVLRPLHMLKLRGLIDYTILPEKVIYFNQEQLSDYIKCNTKLFAITLASNLTGQLVFHSNLARIAHELGVTVFVDSSQGAGKKLIHMKQDGIDYLAFTGHKDLFAIPGVGGLVSLHRMEIEPLLQGGTGIHGESFVNPDAYPDSYEAGTLNMPAIWSLKSSIDYIDANIRDIEKKERQLLNILMSQLSQNENVIIYNSDYDRVPTICFNIKNMSSSEIVRLLDEHDICVRGGIHCAILAHQTIGTVETGAVRVSLNAFNSAEEIEEFIEIIEEIQTICT